MQRLSKIVLVVGLLISFAGCSILNLDQLKSKDLVLLPIDQGPENYLYKQKVTIEGGGKRRDFIAISRLNHKALKVIVLLANGQKIMSLNYDGRIFQQDSVSKMDIPAQDIMAIMQFSLWPKAAVMQHYAVDDGWTTKIGHNKRILKDHNQLVLEVSYLAKELSVYNVRDDYRVYIRNLDKTDLSF